jgi:hypothetical protein
MSGRQCESVERGFTIGGVGGARYVPSVILGVLLLWTPYVLALDRMGPAVGQLGQGKFSIGLDYAFSDTDLDASGHSVYTSQQTAAEPPPIIVRQYKKHSATMDRVNMNRLYATVGYGLLEQTDLFVRLGGAQIEYKDDGGTHPALSSGVRSTFYTKGDLQIGGLAQVSWSQAGYKAIPFPNPFNGSQVAMRGDLDLYEIQAALAASYQLTEPFSIYGGPFLYFADGDLDLGRDNPWHVWIPEGKALSLKSSYDIEETCRLGVYIGAEYKITAGVTWGIECQYTPDAEAIATGLAWRL